MFDKFTKATGSEEYPNIVAGAWKFCDRGKFSVTKDELVVTAQDMVNAQLGTGKFLHVFVRGTAKDELGICFMYELGADEVDKNRDYLRKPYEDFFMRRHGRAFRGHDIGLGVDIIILAH